MRDGPDNALEDAFDDGNDSDDADEADDRQRLMRGDPTITATTTNNTSAESNAAAAQPSSTQRRATMLPTFTSNSRVIGTGSSNDGVFANLNAKPERAEKQEEDLPPSYEQAAADATPPYWETTIMAPGMSSDEVYVDGLPVGSVFSFAWNGMISMSFQLVGFLLTYLLHTTHAAKNGSKAGLGLTLVQYGFYMKGSGVSRPDNDADPYTSPPDPNSHNFDPNSIGDGSGAGGQGGGSGGNGISSITTSEWISYILMVVGWFILIRSVSDFLRARKHEQLILQSPERGLSVPVIAEGESAERVV
ncbi:metal homeostatis protein bsd2 [Talaromyces stipitatus ATCC 10500]|nr:metal homeostatis protein bsd2 [Talaromyces stipitatus ATCC 10500]EED17676.1 metal homeostatis protein bsd2 [Talaromyces stipitatus ATCC 10500]